jgi:hypothetical protein
VFYNIDKLVLVVLILAVVVLLVDIVLVIYIFHRRLSRNRFFQRKDATRRQLSSTVRNFLAGDIGVDEATEALRSAKSPPAREAVQDMLLDGIGSNNRRAVTEVLMRLGLVAIWAKEAFGARRARQLINHVANGASLPPQGKKSFQGIRSMRLFCVKRARSVALLGQLDGDYAQAFMDEAQHDPSPYVGRANVAAMGQNRESFAVSVLLELLRQAAEGVNGLSVLSVKTALVRYPLTELAQFTHCLSDPNEKFRYLVVDSIREICDNTNLTLSTQDFPPDLYRWFLDQAKHDSSVDVRARSARVIRHFHDTGAVLGLRTLMQDDNEFVRLHAVRSCADPYYTDLVPDVVQRIGDAKWRVREAAVKTLSTFGIEGRTQLANYFLSTPDQYASEQIVDEMQRGGIIGDLLPGLGSDGPESWVVMKVCSKMVRMGKTSLLTELLSREIRMSRLGDAPSAAQIAAMETAQKARTQLLDVLAMSPTPQLMETVQSLARRDRDHLKGKAQTILQSGIEANKSTAVETGGA